MAKKRVGGFTRRKDGGWTRWYKGKARHVAGKSASVDQLDELWRAKRKAIDADAAPSPRRRGGAMTLRDLSAGFFAHIDHRHATGKPKPISERMVLNYKTDVNDFGKAVGGSTLIDDVGPDEFAAYAKPIAGQRASGYASKVAHVRALFNWAVQMEYLDRVRFGPAFVVPSKQQIRDERIAKPKSFDPAGVKTLIDSAGPTMRAMILLGAVAAMTAAEVATLTRDVVDLDTGIIDFRRRKTGKVRRVIPLPPDVVAELKAYVRPAPADPAFADYFFLTDRARRGASRPGVPYMRMRETHQASVISTLFHRLATERGVKAHGGGAGFGGLRTTFVNLSPPNAREEVELLTGHALGTILTDHYLEAVGLDRLRRVVDHVWETIKTARPDATPESPAATKTPSAA